MAERSRSPALEECRKLVAERSRSRHENINNIMKGYVYILKCANELYYTGSTNNIEKRILEHQSGLGANFTRKNLPVQLVYFEEFSRIDDAFYREKQIQGWSRKKKEALINGEANLLHLLAACKNDSHFKNK